MPSARLNIYFFLAEPEDLEEDRDDDDLEDDRDDDEREDDREDEDLE
jgi:hypothetical protein